MRLWFFSQSALSFSRFFLGELRASSPPLLQRHLNLFVRNPRLPVFFCRGWPLESLFPIVSQRGQKRSETLLTQLIDQAIGLTNSTEILTPEKEEFAAAKRQR
jgi:hypothetical protein